MKKLSLIIAMLINNMALWANGVCVVDADSAKYLHLISSNVQVEVYNQIAITVATQEFRNEFLNDENFVFAFPVPENASATGLRWFSNGEWNEANFSAEPQDTILPGSGGGSTNTNLNNYLGIQPLYFHINNAIEPDSTIIIELTYVELLPYKFGIVKYFYPNDYLLIQNTPLVEQSFNLTLSSGRVIENLITTSHEAEANVAFTDYTGTVTVMLYEQPADRDYEQQYTLSATDLGVVGFSNYFPETLGCDAYGLGYCAFIAEPDGSAVSPIINKVFTLIIDRSGSMNGTKMEQAKNAASFIVQNLNEGDRFNVIDFDNQITSLFTTHQYFNPGTMASALNYIANLYADGSTNISGAFETAIPQFGAATADTYNVIIFLTDGEATAGITNTPGILNAVNDLISITETDISIFSFGIGGYVNEQLLTLLANQNNGIATFLKNDELEEVITNFYLTIQNPVLLNTNMTISPDLVSETYPIPLPNLFKGIQMLVVGRYNTPGTVNVNLSGNAFGTPVSYDYPLTLSENNTLQMQFLPKLWAKQKIAYLMQQYYSSTGAIAELIHDQIVELSTCYGVISPFTSFSDNTGGTTDIAQEWLTENQTSNTVNINGIYPNPATDKVQIKIICKQLLIEKATLTIYNVLGQVVATYTIFLNGKGEYLVDWNLQNNEGQRVLNGYYFAVINTSSGSASGKFTVLGQ
ncbi:MAG: VWA domain-containing protein [Sphingobacteriales bacterium]|nr:MAG: VWA domain-containing protein [Sphingobacteriales bacterium]